MAIKDEIGNIYNYLTVIERMPNNKENRAMWKCRCKCGNEIIVSGKSLRQGNTTSCGCYQKERVIESNMSRGGGDLTGQRFGKLIVLNFSRWIQHKNGKRDRMWLCRCDCGNQCEVNHRYLRCGDTSSCGCINSIGNMTINRLLNQNHINYKSEFFFSDLLTENREYYRYDFGLLDENNCLLGLIEYQGDIHFTFRENGWNTKEVFIKRQKSDQAKKEYCIKNNIKLFYITYEDNIEEKLQEVINELYGK